jgi:hypothetical protein
MHVCSHALRMACCALQVQVPVCTPPCETHSRSVGMTTRPSRLTPCASSVLTVRHALCSLFATMISTHATEARAAFVDGARVRRLLATHAAIVLREVEALQNERGAGGAIAVSGRHGGSRRHTRRVRPVATYSPESPLVPGRRGAVRAPSSRCVATAVVAVAVVEPRVINAWICIAHRRG